MSQKTTQKMRCLGFVKSKGRQCLLTAGSNGYCRFHFPICAGFTRSGKKCNAQVRNAQARSTDASLYCRPDHDPTHIRSTDPSIFRVANLRSTRQNVVLEYRDGRDVYTDRVITPVGLRSMELDHALELHLFRDVFDTTTKYIPEYTHDKSITGQLAETIKHLANEKENLNFTSPAINQLKFDALYDYSTQYNAGNSMPSLVSFLNMDKPDGIQLSRKVTCHIQEEMLSGYDHLCSGMLHEVPLFESYEKNLHDLVIVSMKLK